MGARRWRRWRSVSFIFCADLTRKITEILQMKKVHIEQWVLHDETKLWKQIIRTSSVGNSRRFKNQSYFIKTNEIPSELSRENRVLTQIATAPSTTTAGRKRAQKWRTAHAWKWPFAVAPNPTTWRPVLKLIIDCFSLDQESIWRFWFSANYVFSAFYQQRKHVRWRTAWSLGSGGPKVAIWRVTVTYSPQDSASTTAKEEVSVATRSKSPILYLHNVKRTLLLWNGFVFRWCL